MKISIVTGFSMLKKSVKVKLVSMISSSGSSIFGGSSLTQELKNKHNNTKTTESAFGFKVTEEEMIEGGKMIPAIEPNTDKLMMLFTKAAVEAKHAEGVRDKSYKKGFCNGVGKAIMAINPSLKERLQDIVNNAKDQDLDDSDSFI